MKDEPATDDEFFEDSHYAPDDDDKPGFQALTFDAARYEAMIGEMEISEDQAHEFLGILWNMMVACADLGIEIDLGGFDLAESCGQVDPVPDELHSVVLDSFNQQSTTVPGGRAKLAPDRESRKEKA